MAWVRQISEVDAAGELAGAFLRVKERAGKVPNIAKIQSLRPETMARPVEGT